MKIHKFKSGEKTRDSLVWWVCLCVMVVLIVFINSFVLTLAIVSGNSMYPSLRAGDFLIVDRIHKMPSRGDVILVRVSPIEAGGQYIVKRVIAFGGERVAIDYDKNEVSINGEVLSEPYINCEEVDPMSGGTSTIEYEIPSGYVFVMGDNRNHSMDSRDERIGFVSVEMIIGKVITPFE